MEFWKPMADWPGYEVSSQGRIRSLQRVIIRSNGRPHTVPQRILKLAVDTSGYHQFKAYQGDGTKTCVLVAREVYKAFIATIPDGWDVDHMDSNKLNNRVGNLQCLTRTQHQRISRQRRVDAGYEAGYADGYAAAMREKQ